MKAPMPIRPAIRIVVATRESKDDFYAKTALGRSLALYNFPSSELRLFEKNTTGLPVLYNQAIEEARNNPAVLVFVHDDIHLCDFDWAEKILNALDVFQIMGLAGNKRRVPKQPAWLFIDDDLTWDDLGNLSGAVGHGSGFPPQNLSIFGAARQEVKLLDGLLLAAHSQTLITKNIRFDERFAFHFYDMDFCRQAEAQNVTMGTWPLSVIHESEGNFGGDAWRAAYAQYLDKWQDGKRESAIRTPRRKTLWECCAEAAGKISW
jgi:hypothetical protein